MPNNVRKHGGERSFIHLLFQSSRPFFKQHRQHSNEKTLLVLSVIGTNISAQVSRTAPFSEKVRHGCAIPSTRGTVFEPSQQTHSRQATRESPSNHSRLRYWSTGRRERHYMHASFTAAWLLPSIYWRLPSRPSEPTKQFSERSLCWIDSRCVEQDDERK